ncbi:MAG: GtrA family protein [Lachnospiraceae bacterium]
MKSTIVIPAYEPHEQFISLVHRLIEATDRVILIVNDGSGPAYASIFNSIAQMGVVLLEHSANRGKGAALKTAMKYQLEHFPSSLGIVTADCDGQHAVIDILTIAEALDASANTLVLGSRDFTAPDVPFKSRFGNRITSTVYGLSTGLWHVDTQTGLRGIPQTSLPELIQLKGERFDYEMNMLMEIPELKVTLLRIPIQTLYFGKNKHSHFRVLKDSYLVYRPFLTFAASSICSALADITLFAILYTFLSANAAFGLLLATALARICSGILNFNLNRRIVFHSKAGASQESLRYGILFVSQLLLSWLLVKMFSEVFPWVVLIKIIVDTSLFVLSFYIQRTVVFRRKKEQTA